MASLVDLPELVGFFSYSREDDEDSQGTLSQLRDRIQRELRGQLGRSMKTFRLWQDKEAIASGTLWETEIKNAVDQAVFFIPIITPTVVRSPYCRFELESFLTRELALERKDLVFPILYIRVPDLEDAERQKNDPVLSIIAKRQYLDWREFRHRDLNSPDVKAAIERFCANVCGALNRTWISPEERKEREELAARRRAEADRIRQEAEGKRREDRAQKQAVAELSGYATEDVRTTPQTTQSQLADDAAGTLVAKIGSRFRALPRSALIASSAIGILLVGAIGLWLAITPRPPVLPAVTAAGQVSRATPPATTAAQISPATPPTTAAGRTPDQTAYSEPGRESAPKPYSPPSAQINKRVALVIGNSRYLTGPPLSTPENDAHLMAQTLRSLGFSLVGGDAQLNLDEDKFRHIVKQFGDQIQGADAGFFYYTGNGIEIDNTNYLVPTDADLTKEADVDFMIDANLVLHQMAGAGTKLKVVILDACRNNPFAAGGRSIAIGRGRDSQDMRIRDIGVAKGGLAQMPALDGTVIAFATQPGQTAADDAEANSPFTKALAEVIKTPGLGILDVLSEVGRQVMEATKRNQRPQRPWFSASAVDNSFYFSPASPPKGASTTTNAR